MSSKHWNGKSAIVCGASAGLGRELALELVAQEVRQLVLIARSADRLSNLREHLLVKKRAEFQVLALTADVCDKQQLGNVSNQLRERGGHVDLVIQAVGKSDRGTLSSLTQSHLHELLETNLVSSLNAIQCFQPIVKQPGGTIVLVGSLASRFAPRYLGGYAIAKHGLAALAQQARLELAAEGIHVMLACPGPIARDDAEQRYAASSGIEQLPAAALQPGGGARLRGLASRRLAKDILASAARKKSEIMRPRKAWLLHIISAVSPRLGDRLLRKFTG